MNKNIYRQYDSRWGKLPYPKGKYTMSSSGCGCCAVTHCIIEQDKYKDWTPKNVQPHMKQYATCGNGTLWDGITKSLEHYGYNVHWRQADTMADIFKVLAKSLKRGIILFGSTKGSDGTVWTTGGHYIAFTDYKIDNGKHYFYLKDSGSRKHDKWWQYEKSMKGDVKHVWICTSLKELPKETSKAEKLAKMGEALSWPLGTPEAKWCYKTGNPTEICKSAMIERGYTKRVQFSDCGYFQNTIVYKTLGLKVNILKGNKDAFEKVEGFEIVHQGAVGESTLVRGDIIRYKKTNGHQHTVMYLGNGIITEAGREGRFGRMAKSQKYTKGNVRKNTLQVLRVKE